MGKTRKVLLIGLALVTAISLLTACGKSNTQSNKTSAKKAEIHIAINAAPSSLDITKTGGDITRLIADGNIFESLVNMKSDFTSGNELAESIDVNKDYTMYTFKLRKGVKFHNNQEMKADDVVASMNRWIQCFGNAKQMVGKSVFEKVDDYTVKIALEKSTPYLAELMATAGNQPAIMPASIVNGVDSKTGLVKEFIGTGPYKFADWKQDQYIKLTKFDGYVPYGTKGKIDARVGYKVAETKDIFYHFVKDPATRVSGVKTGEYDFSYMLPLDNFSEFKDTNKFKIYNTVAGSLGMIYNKKQGVASNVKFRQAVNAALDEDAIMNSAYTGKEFYRLDSSYMVVEQKDWYTKAGSESYNMHNKDKVATLLKEANYNGELFTLLVSSDYTDFYNAAVVIEKQLKDVGINCQLKVGDWATFLQNRANPKAWDGFITSWSPIAIPPLFNWMSTTYPGWVSDQKLLDYESKINFNTDVKGMKDLWKNEIQKYCWNEYLPITKLGDFNMYCVSSSKVNDVVYFTGPFAYNLTVNK